MDANMYFEKFLQIKPRPKVELSPEYQPFLLPERTKITWSQSPMVRIYNALRDEAVKRGLNPDEIKYDFECSCCCGDESLVSISFGDEVEVHVNDDVKNPIVYDTSLDSKNPKLRLLLDLLVANQCEVLDAFEDPHKASRVIYFLEEKDSFETMLRYADKASKAFEPKNPTPAQVEFFKHLSTLEPEVLIGLFLEDKLSDDLDDLDDMVKNK